MSRLARGSGSAGVLVAVAILSLGLLLVAPAATRLDRAAPAARYLAATFQALRFDAVARHRHLGLYFEPATGGRVWWKVEDGNGNGLRTAEIRSGVDPRVEGPYRLGALVERARLGFPPGGPFPRIPPGRGAIAQAAGPVQFGRAELISFGPLGASSTGTVYVTDGHRRLYGVVLYGRTGRVRVWRFDTGVRRWRL